MVGRRQWIAATAAVAAFAIVLCGGAAGALAAAAPDPGGSETTPVQLPPAGGKLFGFTSGGGSLLQQPGPDDAATLITRAGGDLVRVPLEWRDVEPERDVWDADAWAGYQQVYDAMVARGVTPLFTLIAAPTWARDLLFRMCTSEASGTCVYPPAASPEMLGQWQEFAAAVARRFPLAAIGIWNEPNLAGNWGSSVDPARYAELVARADAAIKAVNPTQTVVAGGLATKIVREPSPDMDFRSFYRQALQASPTLRDSEDAIDFHPYPSGPTAQLGAGSRFARIFLEMRTVTRNYGDPSTPFWITEFGTSTAGPGAATQAEQADMLIRGVRRMLTMSDVTAVVVHSLVDNQTRPAPDPESGFGVLLSGDTMPLPPKQAYCAIVAEAGQSYSLC